MVDPATAIGIASAVIAFLDFSAKIITGAKEIYDSADGSLDKNTHRKQIVDDFDDLSQNISTRLITNQVPLSEDEQKLRQIAEESQKTCNELKTILMGLTAGGKSKRSSLQTAWKSRRKEGDVQTLYKRIRDYRSQMSLRLSKMQLDGNTQLQKDLEKLREAVQRSIRTDEELEANVRACILNHLAFESMSSRQENISEPEAGTLDWITKSPKDDEGLGSHDIPEEFIREQSKARAEARNQYMSWLKGTGPSAAAPSPTVTATSSIWFIAGKAGSGKSTLMRRLFEHAQSHPQLLAWANNRRIVFVAFFFWVASNTKLQMTVQGLYRSVLYRILSECPELARILFPDQWDAIYDRMRQKVDDPGGKLGAALFDGKALRTAFERVFDSSSTLASRYCFCLFLDGLDEFRATANYGKKDFQNTQESSREIARDILRWSNAEHTRICCSARPHAEFEFLQSKAMVMHLENANLCDIYRYCKHTIEISDYNNQFGARSRSLSHSLTKRCKGVFLWALLTVKVLIPALEQEDSDPVLEAKLEAIPDEIDALYDQLLGEVARTDREQSDQVLLLALKAKNTKLGILPAYWVLWLDEVQDPSQPISDKPSDHDPKHRDQCLNMARRKLNRLTRGILEVSTVTVSPDIPADEIVMLDQRSEIPAPKKALLGPAVEFFHRTAYDYIQERHRQGQLRVEAPESEINTVFARLYVAHYVHRTRIISFAIDGIRLCVPSVNVHHRCIHFLADSIALGVRQRCQQRQVHRGTLSAVFPGGAVRFSTTSCRRLLAGTHGDSTPVLADITSLGYMFAADAGVWSHDFDWLFPDPDLRRTLRRRNFSKAAAGKKTAGIDFQWKETVREVTAGVDPCFRWQSSDLFALFAVHYTSRRTASEVLPTKARRQLEEDTAFSSFLRGGTESGLPYPPWMFLAACIINNKVGADTPTRTSFCKDAADSILPRIIPPAAQGKAVVTLSPVGAFELRPHLEGLLVVCVDKDMNDDDKDGPGRYSHVRSIEYEGHKVEGSSAFLVLCPGLSVAEAVGENPGTEALDQRPSRAVPMPAHPPPRRTFGATLRPRPYEIGPDRTVVWRSEALP